MQVTTGMSTHGHDNRRIALPTDAEGCVTLRMTADQVMTVQVAGRDNWDGLADAPVYGIRSVVISASTTLRTFVWYVLRTTSTDLANQLFTNGHIRLITGSEDCNTRLGVASGSTSMVHILGSVANTPTFFFTGSGHYDDLLYARLRLTEHAEDWLCEDPLWPDLPGDPYKSLTHIRYVAIDEQVTTAPATHMWGTELANTAARSSSSMWARAPSLRLLSRCAALDVQTKFYH